MLSTGTQLNPWQLVLDATPVVQLVLVSLVVMAVACWYVVGAKLMRLSKAERDTKNFLERFWQEDQAHSWSVEAMNTLHRRLKQYTNSPVAAVFRAGYAELSKVARKGAPTLRDTDNIERALRRAINAETTRLESLISLLATTGSTAPFVGLFGTVWGIMNAFIAIAGEKSATLDVVAPGIAEALIATALGLAAAIPAVIAYNYFLGRIRVIESEIDAFANDYLNIIRRHLLTE